MAAAWRRSPRAHTVETGQPFGKQHAVPQKIKNRITGGPSTPLQVRVRENPEQGLKETLAHRAHDRSQMGPGRRGCAQPQKGSYDTTPRNTSQPPRGEARAIPPTRGPGVAKFTRQQTEGGRQGLRPRRRKGSEHLMGQGLGSAGQRARSQAGTQAGPCGWLTGTGARAQQLQERASPVAGVLPPWKTTGCGPRACGWSCRLRGLESLGLAGDAPLWPPGAASARLS